MVAAQWIGFVYLGKMIRTSLLSQVAETSSYFPPNTMNFINASQCSNNMHVLRKVCAEI